jgi:hypothetical protein
MSTSNASLRRYAVLAVALLLAQGASAGPPLVCNPFHTGDEPLLPWAKPVGPYTPDRRYDVERLTADTLEVLSPNAPTLARMENLRRATIYASMDRDTANDLLKALLERTRVTGSTRRATALAWFDAGYLVEAFRQQSDTQKHDMLAEFDAAAPGLRSELGALDGYVFVQKALAITSEPEMEYAAALMTRDHDAAERHRATAAAGAAAGSLLAMNLENW